LNAKNGGMDLILSFLKKWLFPDFTNKLTWLVVSVGAGILLTPAPVKLLFYNWLVSIFNLNSGVPYTLPQLNNDSPHSLYGVALIAMGLAHNHANQYLRSKTSSRTDLVREQRERADKVLFEKFLSEFPSNCKSVLFLQNHDFGATYHGSDTNEIEYFYYSWNIPERTFLNQNIENKKIELSQACKEFLEYLAINSGPLKMNIEFFSIVPDMYVGHYPEPDIVVERKDRLNQLATNCYNLHREFVELCKEELNC